MSALSCRIYCSIEFDTPQLEGQRGVGAGVRERERGGDRERERRGMGQRERERERERERGKGMEVWGVIETIDKDGENGLMLGCFPR